MPAEKPSPPAVTLKDSDVSSMSKNERIKLESQGLFFVAGKDGIHTFLDEVEAMDRGEAETLGGEAKELSKFFGVYKQQLRGERGRKTKDFSFMVRIKAPAGGGFSKEQWCALDDAADQFADGTLRITSRQGIQFHRVKGKLLAPLVRHLNRHYRKGATLGACGDVNRNVMCSPIDGVDREHATGGRDLAFELADALAPQTTAYFQIFLSDDEGRNVKPVSSDEPLYGKHYLPRKFKIGIAHPGDNSVDVLTQDVGLVPVRTNGSCDGSVWDLYSGGGLGLTHNNPKTAALLGLYFGRIRREQVVEAAKAIAIVQKENGDRKDRRQARWKYTIRRLGLDAVKAELASRGIEIEDAEPQPLPPMELHLGWHEQRGEGGYYGISVENGRVKTELREALRAAVEELGLSVRATAQQDLILCDVPSREALEEILARHGVRPNEGVSLVRRNAMACPAKPTCGLAMTDAENILPVYVDAIDAAGLGDVDVVIRMTGCPNNCARPPTAEIGIYGYGKNDHVILVGGSREGSRLAHTLYERVSGEKMVEILTGILRAVKERADGIPAGEFLHRSSPEELRGWVGVEDGELAVRRDEAERIVAEAVDAGLLEREPAAALAASMRAPAVFEAILEGASESKRRGKGDVVSVSKNIFIPLTNLCRDRCAYCTFAKLPDSADAKTYTLDEVADAVKGGMRAGCTEALFCLGDKPEVAYKSHREWLGARGFSTTAEYLEQGCHVAFELGMLPHTNAGILSAEEMQRLRRWNASMGLMMETTSGRLRGKDMAHYYAPDKDPEVRLRMHEEAGEIGVPFTSGILLGIGENDAERVDTLLAIRDLSDRYGHIQEVIVQPFHPKEHTPMEGVAPLSDEDVAGWVALARLVLGPDQNVQAPPNLAPEVLELLLRSGLNDWGGVSPVTVDFINPEAPWPALAELARRTEAAGQHLVERLPIYPEQLARPELFEPDVRARCLALATERGWANPSARVEAA